LDGCEVEGVGEKVLIPAAFSGKFSPKVKIGKLVNAERGEKTTSGPAVKRTPHFPQKTLKD